MILDEKTIKPSRYYAIESDGKISAEEIISDLISDTGLSNQQLVSAWVNDSILLDIDLENLIRWYLIDGAILAIQGPSTTQSINKLLSVMNNKYKNPRNFQFQIIVTENDVVLVRVFKCPKHDESKHDLHDMDIGEIVIEGFEGLGGQVKPRRVHWDEKIEQIRVIELDDTEIQEKRLCWVNIRSMVKYNKNCAYYDKLFGGDCKQ